MTTTRILAIAAVGGLFAAPAAFAQVNNAPTPAIDAGPLKLTFGGFAELSGIWRNRNETADISTNFNTQIPFPNDPRYHMTEFRGTARQSRLSLLTEGPKDGDASIEVYLEMDFQSSASTANSIESNSYNPRLRQYYGVYKRESSEIYVLAGQAFSLATLYRKGLTPRSEDIPLTVDGQYVVGFNWTRNPQIRAVKTFAQQFTVGVSLESPQANIFASPAGTLVPTVVTEPGGFLLNPNQQYSTDLYPDVIAKLAWDPGWGHYEVYGMGRAFRSRHHGNNHITYSGAGGGGAILPIVGKYVDFQLSGLVGKGIGRYGSAQLPDVAVSPDGELKTVKAYQILAGFNFRPTDTWTFYAYGGIEDAHPQDFVEVVNGVPTGFGYGSPLYDNRGCSIEGSTACAANTARVEQAAAGFWWKYYQGVLGNAQLGVQGSWTQRSAFAGLGGDPRTTMAVGFVSFRFYPYQK